MGASPGRSHPRLRCARGMACGSHLEKRSDGTLARRVAHRRHDRDPRQRRHRRKSIDRLEGLRRIGIDEISYKRGHRYLIVVVDHDTGHLVWAGPGRNDAALNVFFDELGPERAALLTHVSADMADWIARVVARRAPNATRSADPFHVVAWAIDALDIERRRAWNEAKGRHSTRDVGRRPPRDRRRQTHRPVPLRALEEPW